jgi:histidine ammonia-lyase
MNGTSFHTGAAAVLVARARRAAAAAEVASALAMEVLGGHLEALAPELHLARPHPGQRAVAARLRRLLAGSRLVRTDEPAAARQDPYTLRCAPQVLGAAVDAIEAVAVVVETEIDSVSDNPLFLADEGRVLHGGNFHGQPVAAALDQLKLAAAELGVLSERRLARLLDASLNGGLPPFLVRGAAGLHSGFMGLQYCASAMAAENGVLVAPASVRSVPTNANNQDIVSMGMVAARQAAAVIANAERMLAIEILCAAQALELRGVENAAGATRAAYDRVRRGAARLDEDRPLADDVETVRRLIVAGELEA